MPLPLALPAVLGAGAPGLGGMADALAGAAESGPGSSSSARVDFAAGGNTKIGGGIRPIVNVGKGAQVNAPESNSAAPQAGGIPTWLLIVGGLFVLGIGALLMLRR